MFTPPIRMAMPLLVRSGPFPGTFLGTNFAAKKQWPIRSLNLDTAWKEFVRHMVDSGSKP